jgi:hypothetical protein
MIVALDLEGTLLSNAISAFPRPGLFDFLEFCGRYFQKTVIYTSVPRDKASAILQLLVSEGSAPAWGATVEIFTCERGEMKDLQRVCPRVDEVLLADDQEGYVLPEQRCQWVPVQEFLPPFTQEDDELERVKAVILARMRK